MSDQLQSQPKGSWWSEILPQLTTTVIGAASALLGVILGNIMDSNRFDTQKSFEIKNQVLNQRIIILDRAASIFGMSPGISDYWDEYLRTKFSKGNQPVEIIGKLTEYQGEFQSVVWLASVYFGPKTKAAIDSLGNEVGPWWTKSKARQDAFMAAMFEELSYGMK